MATVLSGISGAFYYKPAGTVASFVPADVDTSTDEIFVGTFLGFEASDPVVFSIYSPQDGPISGTLPAGISDSTTYYVIEYTKETGILKVSSTYPGSSINISSSGTVASPARFRVSYKDYAAVSEVRDWSFEFSRSEIDVSKIGQVLGQYTPFRSYIPGFADGNGTVNVYMTDEEKTISSRIISDVLKRQQVGAAIKLYVDRVKVGGVVSDSLSRSIELEAVLTSASLKANPDDASMVSINFRPSGFVNPDFSQGTIEPPAPPVVSSDYWSDMSVQLYGWEENVYIGWWGN